MYSYRDKYLVLYCQYLDIVAWKVFYKFLSVLDTCEELSPMPTNVSLCGVATYYGQNQHLF